MNYIELINKFWQCNNERPIGCNATALYFYLLNLCNSLGWKDTFRHSDRYISLQLGISINTVRAAKNSLKQLNLVDFKAPQKASRGLDGVTVYSFKTISKFDTVPDTVPDTVVNTVVNTVPDTLNKLNKTKQKKESKKENPPSQISFKQFSESDFYNSLKPFVKEFGKQTVRDFYDYWTEPSPSGKMRFQLEKTWSAKGRLSTWKRNEEKYGVKSTPKVDKVQPEILGPWAS